jgi:FAD/FMN-containing dehydrogenase
MRNMLSWGRYPYTKQDGHALAWRDAARATIAEACEMQGTTLAFGNGRSYGDSCLATSGHVVATARLDRFIAVDWQTGVLRLESGVTFEQILELSIRRGWMLPVTPGTKYVTVGGAIANDVHGKNHHVRGTFGRHVLRFALARSDGIVYECAIDEHPELFAATIGGLGLTGLITWAEIQLMPIRSNMVNVKTNRFGNLDEFFDLSERLDPLHEYSVAWVDCQSRGASLGRGVFMVGDHDDHGPLEVDHRKKRRVPFTLPIPVFNRVTLRVFNELYFRHQHPRETLSSVGYDKYFYPLDGLLEWNRIYGRAGFQQYQCVVPHDVARDSIRAILDVVGKSGTGSFLAVLKRCGSLRSPGMLSFPLEGTSLALDFPQREAQNIPLFAKLDTIVREAHGRLYPAKDAHMTGADFRAAYPRWQQLESLRDPAMLSRFWERTTQI